MSTRRSSGSEPRIDFQFDRGAPSRLGLVLALGLSLLAPLLSAQDLSTYRERANSDDAASIEEAFFHGEARALVIGKIEPNPLGVGGREFRVKRHPEGTGCFVYEPRTRFEGTERKFVWWVSEAREVFVVNGATTYLTPTLEYTQGILPHSAMEIVAYIFDHEPLIAIPTEEGASPGWTFTVKEYHVYREVLDTPMSLTEEQANARAARCYGLTIPQVQSTAHQVQEILHENRWFGRPTAEVRRASDWNGQPAHGKCGGGQPLVSL